jgi:hypothetical protein
MTCYSVFGDSFNSNFKVQTPLLNMKKHFKITNFEYVCPTLKVEPDKNVESLQPDSTTA